MKTQLQKVLFVSAGILAICLSATAQPKSDDVAAKEYKRLVVLQTALRKIPYDRYDKEPHKSFLKKHEKEISYSDPSAEYYVNSDLFWDLHKQYRTHAIAEEIAWTAANNPIPGECEGFLSCHLYALNATWARYLSFYPQGKYSVKALSLLSQDLSPMVADRVKKSVYEGPGDAAERADMQRTLVELETSVSKTTGRAGTRVRSQVKLLRQAHR